MTKREYMYFHEECCRKLVAITQKKNSDYTGNNDDPFANFQQIGHLISVPRAVEIGFVTRMSDKLSRIASFVSKGNLTISEETVEDTLLDLANYCILLAGFLRSISGKPPLPQQQEMPMSISEKETEYQPIMSIGGKEIEGNMRPILLSRKQILDAAKELEKSAGTYYVFSVYARA